MTLINYNDQVQIINLDGDNIGITITEDSVRKALHLHKGTISYIGKFTKAKQEEVFYMKLDQASPYANVKEPSVVAPLQICAQDFTFQNLERYQRPFISTR